MEEFASTASIRFNQELLRGLEYEVESWEGKEGFNQIAEQVVAIRCRSAELRLEAFFLKAAELEIDYRRAPGEIVTRSIKGLIRKSGRTVDERCRFVYTFYVVPRLWLLSQTESTRIFYNRSIPEIICDVIGAYQIPCEMNVTRVHRTREHCVQYQESDLNFIMRLAEDSGISFFFRHQDDMTVFIDNPNFLDETALLHECAWIQERDHDPSRSNAELEPDPMLPLWLEQPASAYLAEAPRRLGGRNSGSVRIGRRTKPGGCAVTVIRDDDPCSAPNVVTIHSALRSAAAGALIVLTGFPVPALADEYQIVRVDHCWEDQTYHNRIRCITRLVSYRPPRFAHRPIILGVQTATVVGANVGSELGVSDGELYVDDIGRIKVRFQWDLPPSAAEQPSCWVHFAHDYNGPNHGLNCLPRVGATVLVAFSGGDPDHPLVVGSAPNLNYLLPRPISSSANDITIRTSAFLELRLEAKQSQFPVALEARKDWVRTAESEVAGENRLDRGLNRDCLGISGRNERKFEA